jgi:hypothetical protein
MQSVCRSVRRYGRRQKDRRQEQEAEQRYRQTSPDRISSYFHRGFPHILQNSNDIIPYLKKKVNRFRIAGSFLRRKKHPSVAFVNNL